MTEPTKKTIKKLFALSGNICAFPGCSVPIVDTNGTVAGEICHIYARSDGGPRFNASLAIRDRHAFGNLILLCAQHHKVVDDEPEIYTAEILFEMKAAHESAKERAELAEDSLYAQIFLNSYNKVDANNNSGNIAINSPGSIQAHVLTVKAERKTIKMAPPSGTLGADSILSKYIQYLINCYNKYASTKLGHKSRFNYGAISKNIEDRFGARWQLLDMAYAKEVVVYLQ